MRTRLALRKNRRCIWLDRENRDCGILLLQVFARARNRTARANAGYERIDLPVSIRPDFGTRRHLMIGWVRRIFKLL